MSRNLKKNEPIFPKEKAGSFSDEFSRLLDDVNKSESESKSFFQNAPDSKMGRRKKEEKKESFNLKNNAEFDIDGTTHVYYDRETGHIILSASTLNNLSADAEKFLCEILKTPVRCKESFWAPQCSNIAIHKDFYVKIKEKSAGLIVVRDEVLSTFLNAAHQLGQTLDCVSEVSNIKTLVGVEFECINKCKEKPCIDESKITHLLKWLAVVSNISFKEFLTQENLHSDPKDIFCFSGMVLNKNNFVGKDLRGFNLSYSSLYKCQFTNSNLESVDLNKANITKTNLTSKQLIHSYFSELIICSNTKHSGSISNKKKHQKNYFFLLMQVKVAFKFLLEKIDSIENDFLPINSVYIDNVWVSIFKDHPYVGALSEKARNLEKKK